MKHLRGLSPLIAVVMLIAFTLLVAGILGGLVTQFATEQRANIQYCTGARALILGGAKIDAGEGLHTGIINIHNFGDVDLTFSLLQTHANGTVTKLPGTTKIRAGDVDQVTIQNVNFTATTEFTVQSLECPGAQDLIRGTDFRAV